jgi:hypothetical protein
VPALRRGVSPAAKDFHREKLPKHRLGEKCDGKMQKNFGLLVNASRGMARANWRRIMALMMARAIALDVGGG